MDPRAMQDQFGMITDNPGNLSAGSTQALRKDGTEDLANATLSAERFDYTYDYPPQTLIKTSKDGLYIPSSGNASSFSSAGTTQIVLTSPFPMDVSSIRVDVEFAVNATAGAVNGDYAVAPYWPNICCTCDLQLGTSQTSISQYTNTQNYYVKRTLDTLLNDFGERLTDGFSIGYYHFEVADTDHQSTPLDFAPGYAVGPLVAGDPDLWAACLKMPYDIINTNKTWPANVPFTLYLKWNPDSLADAIILNSALTAPQKAAYVAPGNLLFRIAGVYCTSLEVNVEILNNQLKNFSAVTLAQSTFQAPTGAMPGTRAGLGNPYLEKAALIPFKAFTMNRSPAIGTGPNVQTQVQLFSSVPLPTHVFIYFEPNQVGVNPLWSTLPIVSYQFMLNGVPVSPQPWPVASPSSVYQQMRNELDNGRLIDLPYENFLKGERMISCCLAQTRDIHAVNPVISGTLSVNIVWAAPFAGNLVHVAAYDQKIMINQAGGVQKAITTI